MIFAVAYGGGLLWEEGQMIKISKGIVLAGLALFSGLTFAQVNDRPMRETRGLMQIGTFEQISERYILWTLVEASGEQKEKASVMLSTNQMTNKALADALIYAHQKGITLSVLIGKNARKVKGDQTSKLVKAGVPVWLDLKHDAPPYMYFGWSRQVCFSTGDIGAASQTPGLIFCSFGDPPERFLLDYENPHQKCRLRLTDGPAL